MDDMIIDLPTTGFIRLPLILKLLSIGRSTWYKGLKEGRFPKGVKLSSRVIAWRVEDIRKLISDLSTISTETWSGKVVEGISDLSS